MSAQLQLPSTDFGKTNPFIAHLGFVLTAFAGGQSELTYTARPEHLNSYGVTHGGAVMTLLDVTMAMAARSDMPQVGVVTVEMKTTFMRPSHGPLVARGKVLHRTVTMAFTEGTVFDESGKACAHATGTFKFVRRLPVGSKTLHDFNNPAAQDDA